MGSQLAAEPGGVAATRHDRTPQPSRRGRRACARSRPPWTSGSGIAERIQAVTSSLWGARRPGLTPGTPLRLRSLEAETEPPGVHGRRQDSSGPTLQLAGLARDGSPSSATGSQRDPTETAGGSPSAAVGTTTACTPPPRAPSATARLAAARDTAEPAPPGLTEARRGRRTGRRLLVLAATGRDPESALHLRDPPTSPAPREGPGPVLLQRRRGPECRCRGVLRLVTRRL